MSNDKTNIKNYFERIAPVWDHWHRRNGFYHRKMCSIIQGMTPPGERVLELGSGTGDLLAALRPSRGIGFNLAEGLTELARRKFPNLEFDTVEVDQLKAPSDFSPDYALMTNMLDNAYDIWDLLENLKPVINDRTLLVITTNNPL